MGRKAFRDLDLAMMMKQVRSPPPCWDEMNRRFVIQSALEGNAGGLVTE